jgi:16S rRNA processing protein RimM
MQSFVGRPSEIPEGYIAIGQITSAFGVRGEVKVTLHTDFPERFLKHPVIYLGPDARPVRVVSARPHQDAMLVRLEGATDRTAAEALRGLWIQIPETDVSPLEEGEQYIFKLIGLRVRTTDGRALGVIAEILSTGANDVFVVQNEAGDEVLIPYISDVIASEQIELGEIVVHPVPGLLD